MKNPHFEQKAPFTFTAQTPHRKPPFLYFMYPNKRTKKLSDLKYLCFLMSHIAGRDNSSEKIDILILKITVKRGFRQALSLFRKPW